MYVQQISTLLLYVQMYRKSERKQRTTMEIRGRMTQQERRKKEKRQRKREWLAKKAIAYK
jgi:hypothetical protein